MREGVYDDKKSNAKSVNKKDEFIGKDDWSQNSASDLSPEAVELGKCHACQRPIIDNKNLVICQTRMCFNKMHRECFVNNEFQCHEVDSDGFEVFDE